MRSALLTLLLAVPLLADGPRIANLRLMASELGMPKAEASVVPGERLLLLYDVVGLKRDGVTLSYKIAFDVVDPSGGTISHWDSGEMKVVDLFATEAQPGSVWYVFQPDAMNGTYTAKLSVEDALTRKTASASVPVTLLPPRLSVVNVGLAADEDCNLPRGRVLVEREAVWVAFSVSGPKLVDGKAHVEADLVVLDENGSIVGWQPNAVDREIAVNAPIVLEECRLSVTRTGRYTVKVVVRDVNADRAKAEYAFPIEVVEAPR